LPIDRLDVEFNLIANPKGLDQLRKQIQDISINKIQLIVDSTAAKAAFQEVSALLRKRQAVINIAVENRNQLNQLEAQVARISRHRKIPIELDTKTISKARENLTLFNEDIRRIAGNLAGLSQISSIEQLGQNFEITRGHLSALRRDLGVTIQAIEQAAQLTTNGVLNLVTGKFTPAQTTPQQKAQILTQLAATRTQQKAGISALVTEAEAGARDFLLELQKLSPITKNVKSAVEILTERGTLGGFGETGRILDPFGRSIAGTGLDQEIQRLSKRIGIEEASPALVARRRQERISELTSLSGLRGAGELLARRSQILGEIKSQRAALQSVDSKIQREALEYVASLAEGLRRITVGLEKEQQRLQKLGSPEVRLAKARRQALFSGSAEELREIESRFGVQGQLRQPRFFEPGRLREKETLVQLGFASAFGGPTSIAAALIGGSTRFGAAGALIGSTIADAVNSRIFEPTFDRLREFSESFKEAGLAFQRSILGIGAIGQLSTRVLGPGGAELPLAGQLEFQQGRAREIQLAARSRLLRLGIAGSTEATFVQGIVSALSQRGFQGNAQQVSRIAELLGGAIQTQRPGLLEQTNLVLRDIEDVISGGPQASRTILSQLIGRPSVEGLKNARSIEDVVKALERLGPLAEAATSANNPAALLNKIGGAIDLLNTTGGERLLTALTPALERFFNVLSDEKTVEAAGKLGNVLGIALGKFQDINTGLFEFGRNATNNFLEPLQKAIPALLGFVGAIVAVEAASLAATRKTVAGSLAGGIAGLLASGSSINLATGEIKATGALPKIGEAISRFFIPALLASIAAEAISVAASAIVDQQDQAINKAIEDSSGLFKKKREIRTQEKIESTFERALKEAGIVEEVQKEVESLRELPRVRLRELIKTISTVEAAGAETTDPLKFSALLSLKSKAERDVSQILRQRIDDSTLGGKRRLAEFDIQDAEREIKNISERRSAVSKLIETIERGGKTQEEARENRKNLEERNKRLEEEFNKASKKRRDEINKKLEERIKLQERSEVLSNFKLSGGTLPGLEDPGFKELREVTDRIKTLNEEIINIRKQDFQERKALDTSLKEASQVSLKSIEQLRNVLESLGDEGLKAAISLDKAKESLLNVRLEEAKKDAASEFRLTSPSRIRGAELDRTVIQSQENSLRARISTIRDEVKLLESQKKLSKDREKTGQLESDILNKRDQISDLEFKLVDIQRPKILNEIERLTSPEVLSDFRAKLITGTGVTTDFSRNIEQILGSVEALNNVSTRIGGLRERENLGTITSAERQELEALIPELARLTQRTEELYSQQSKSLNEITLSSSALKDRFNALQEVISAETDKRKESIFSLQEAQNALQEFKNQATLRELSAQAGILGEVEQFRKQFGRLPENIPGEVATALENPEARRTLFERLAQERINASVRQEQRRPERELSEIFKLEKNIENSRNALDNLTKSTDAARAAFDAFSKGLGERLGGILNNFASLLPQGPISTETRGTSTGTPLGKQLQDITSSVTTNVGLTGAGSLIPGIKSGLEQIPANIIKFLVGSGLKIEEGENVSDVNPELAKLTARGGRKGFSNVPGLFEPDKNRIILSRKEIPSERFAEDTVQHEVGHKLFQIFKSTKLFDAFEEAYKADLDRLSASDRSELSYFLPLEGKAGPISPMNIEQGSNEAFAELFAKFVGEYKKIGPQAEAFSRNFASSSSVVDYFIRNFDSFKFKSETAGTVISPSSPFDRAFEIAPSPISELMSQDLAPLGIPAARFNLPFPNDPEFIKSQQEKGIDIFANPPLFREWALKPGQFAINGEIIQPLSKTPLFSQRIAPVEEGAAFKRAAEIGKEIESIRGDMGKAPSNIKNAAPTLDQIQSNSTDVREILNTIANNTGEQLENKFLKALNSAFA
jgi:hypothetical protein